MKIETSGNFLGQTITVVLLIGVAALTLLTISSASRNGGVQDLMRLETRLSQLEQRLYTIETNLRNVEQQSRFANSRNSNPEDLARLRNEIQELQRRLADDECALAKLDERTLTRDTRRRTATTSSDPCRSQSDTPLKLPNRP